MGTLLFPAWEHFLSTSATFLTATTTTFFIIGWENVLYWVDKAATSLLHHRSNLCQFRSNFLLGTVFFTTVFCGSVMGESSVTVTFVSIDEAISFITGATLQKLTQSLPKKKCENFRFRGEGANGFGMMHISEAG